MLDTYFEGKRKSEELIILQNVEIYNFCLFVTLGTNKMKNFNI